MKALSGRERCVHDAVKPASLATGPMRTTKTVQIRVTTGLLTPSKVLPLICNTTFDSFPFESYPPTTGGLDHKHVRSRIAFSTYPGIHAKRRFSDINTKFLCICIYSVMAVTRLSDFCTYEPLSPDCGNLQLCLLRPHT